MINKLHNNLTKHALISVILLSAAGAFWYTHQSQANDKNQPIEKIQYTVRQKIDLSRNTAMCAAYSMFLTKLNIIENDIKTKNILIKTSNTYLKIAGEIYDDNVAKFNFSSYEEEIMLDLKDHNNSVKYVMEKYNPRCEQLDKDLITYIGNETK
jgi:hypothetical protein